ncbi:MAG: helix-turn-helix transcriptional regulator [Chloroflexi bacterium]|nr:helix-turn-helix transcriptional regulator [Chloroflexota bacterium]
METFGSFLREKREGKGLSQKGLCANPKLQISNSFLSRWETGKEQPTTKHRSIVIALADVLDCTEKEKSKLLKLAGLSPLMREDYDVEKHLNSLKKRWQQTQFLKEVMQYSNEEIGQRLGIREMQVETDLAEARGRDSVGESPSSLVLSVDDHASTVIDQETKREGQLVKFKLSTLLPGNLIVTDEICLEVVNVTPYEEVRRPHIGARLIPAQYMVELKPKQGDIIVTTDQYKYAGRDLDQFEITCTSPPGYTYCVKVVIHYTEEPKENRLSLRSEDILLRFPMEPGIGSRKRPTPDKDDGTRHGIPSVIVGEDRDGKLEKLADLTDEPANDTQTELRLFFKRDLKKTEVRAVKKQIEIKEIILWGQITYANRLLIIPFKYNSIAIQALSNLKLHDFYGWQLINMDAQKEFRDNPPQWPNGSRGVGIKYVLSE